MAWGYESGFPCVMVATARSLTMSQPRCMRPHGVKVELDATARQDGDDPSGMRPFVLGFNLPPTETAA